MRRDDCNARLPEQMHANVIDTMLDHMFAGLVGCSRILSATMLLFFNKEIKFIQGGGDPTWLMNFICFNDANANGWPVEWMGRVTLTLDEFLTAF